ncbi:hypothetical protein MVEN_02033900 [Mycena venus]|uniref:Uncharacterized protein n=1 Tax=Mycena venus TaxID=2733690 RepID=A0A8H7CHQ7_9AGAR|nr:hypothetical protein MVEN_02033900 [Mycena venus]
MPSAPFTFVCLPRPHSPRPRPHSIPPAAPVPLRLRRQQRQRMHSEARTPGPGYTIAEERNDMLDRLNEIPLKGFPEMEETPTSATMSLPTPECQHVPLPPVDAMEVPQTEPVSYLFPTDDTPIVAPGAPRMKDYDTFTEGTAQGSFDFLPAAETNEHGEPIYPISAPVLAALPLNDASCFIERWRQDVEDHLAAQPEPVQAESAPLPIPLRNRAPAPELPLPTSPIIDLTVESEAGTTPTQKRPPPPVQLPRGGR